VVIGDVHGRTIQVEMDLSRESVKRGKFQVVRENESRSDRSVVAHGSEDEQTLCEVLKNCMNVQTASRDLVVLDRMVEAVERGRILTELWRAMPPMDSAEAVRVARTEAELDPRTMWEKTKVEEGAAAFLVTFVGLAFEDAGLPMKYDIRVQVRKDTCEAVALLGSPNLRPVELRLAQAEE
jgi:hypothetical protein